MKTAIKIVAVLGAFGVMFGLGWLSKSTGIGQAAHIASLSARERAFTERMENVVLVGHFTVEGRERRDGLAERYEIARVTKLRGVISKGLETSAGALRCRPLRGRHPMHREIETLPDQEE